MCIKIHNVVPEPYMYLNSSYWDRSNVITVLSTIPPLLCERVFCMLKSILVLYLLP